MKQVRIILNSGKEITFEAEDDFDRQECVGNIPYLAPNGNEYHINADLIAAVTTTPMMKCLHCGEWMIPERYTEKHYLNGITAVKVEARCPKCGCPDDDTSKEAIKQKIDNVFQSALDFENNG